MIDIFGQVFHLLLFQKDLSSIGVYFVKVVGLRTTAYLK